MKKIRLELTGVVVAFAVAVTFICVGCNDSGVADGGKEAETFLKSLYGYESVTIGGKIWMKKNLNIETADSWCHGDNTSNCDKYGRLYTWAAANAACQSIKWQLPTIYDWKALVSAAGDDNSAGNLLKSKSGWVDDGNGTDSYGFSALPGGSRYSNGVFDNNAGYNGYWWTATEYTGNDSSYYRDMHYGNGGVSEQIENKSRGFSVRCVKE